VLAYDNHIQDIYCPVPVGILQYPTGQSGLIPVLPDEYHVQHIDITVTVDIPVGITLHNDICIYNY
jgi:hypothetical protein